MIQEDLEKLKRDIERLLSNMHNPTNCNESFCCTSEEDKMVCPLTSYNHKHALMCLGLTALIAGIAGAFIAKKQSS